MSVPLDYITGTRKATEPVVQRRSRRNRKTVAAAQRPPVLSTRTCWSPSPPGGTTRHAFAYRTVVNRAVCRSRVMWHVGRCVRQRVQPQQSQRIRLPRMSHQPALAARRGMLQRQEGVCSGKCPEGMKRVAPRSVQAGSVTAKNGAPL